MTSESPKKIKRRAFFIQYERGVAKFPHYDIIDFSKEGHD